MNMRNRILALGSLLVLTVATTLPYRFTVYNASPWKAHVQGVVVGANDQFLDVNPGDQRGKQSGTTIANCWKQIIVTLEGVNKREVFKRGLGSNQISSCSDVVIQINPDGSMELL